MNEAQAEAVANADAHISNAGLPTYTELLAELQLAHQIIRNGLAVMTNKQKADWGDRNGTERCDGEGITRANERMAVIAKAKGQTHQKTVQKVSPDAAKS